MKMTLRLSDGGDLKAAFTLPAGPRVNAYVFSIACWGGFLSLDYLPTATPPQLLRRNPNTGCIQLHPSLAGHYDPEGTFTPPEGNVFENESVHFRLVPLEIRWTTPDSQPLIRGVYLVQESDRLNNKLCCITHDGYLFLPGYVGPSSGFHTDWTGRVKIYQPAPGSHTDADLEDDEEEETDEP